MNCYRQNMSSEHRETVPHGLILYNSILVKIEKPHSSQRSDGRVPLVWKTLKLWTWSSKLKLKWSLSPLMWASGPTPFHRQNSGTVLCVLNSTLLFEGQAPNHSKKLDPAAMLFSYGCAHWRSLYADGKKSKGLLLNWTKFGGTVIC